MNNRININDSDSWYNLNWDDPVVPDALKKSDATVNRSRSAFFKKDDPTFSKTMSEVAVTRNQNPEYLESLRVGIAQRNNSYQAECNARPEVKAKISDSMKGKQKSDEHLAKVSARNKERSKPIITPWGEFPSRKAAVIWALENTNIPNVDKKIQKLVKTEGSGFYYK
jgi:hypothetical protein